MAKLASGLPESISSRVLFYEIADGESLLKKDNSLILDGCSSREGVPV